MYTRLLFLLSIAFPTFASPYTPTGNAKTKEFLRAKTHPEDAKDAILNLMWMLLDVEQMILKQPLDLARQNEEKPIAPLSEFDMSNPCSCTGPRCQCCVDFNMTYVDLGGPGCIIMKYISREEGLLLNVSYGESQLHGEQIKGTKASVSCMNLLLDLAQMCARITDVESTDDGMKACAGLEPTILGDPQDTYQLGCFLMGPDGMKMINSTSSIQEEKPPEIKPQVSEEALIDAVNESAEEGIAWFSSFLGLSFGKPLLNDTKPVADSSTPVTTKVT